MAQITISIPDQFIEVLGGSPEAAGAELRMLAAVKLFELTRLSSGAAAQVAGIPRVVFLQRLGQYGAYTFDMTEEDLNKETRLA